jgi:hypothetical protein
MTIPLERVAVPQEKIDNPRCKSWGNTLESSGLWRINLNVTWFLIDFQISLASMPPSKKLLAS